MLADRDLKPFAEIQAVWKNFPYKSPTDSIGTGMVNPPKPQPLPVPAEDIAWLREHAEDIFREAGLYDPVAGRGTLKITLTSYGRWTYGEIFRSFLVDTGYIFLIPATLRVNHQLVLECYRPGNAPSPAGHVEEIGHNKTTFHALILPLYPLFSPGAREHSLLKKMLWKSAIDLYTRTKLPGSSSVDSQENLDKPDAAETEETDD
jgi:hypothetical protein